MLSLHFAPPPTAKKRKAATLASHAVPQRRLGCSCAGTKAEGLPVGSGHRRHLTKSGSGANPRVFRMFRPGTVTGRAGPQPGAFGVLPPPSVGGGEAASLRLPRDTWITADPPAPPGALQRPAGPTPAARRLGARRDLPQTPPRSA